MFVYLLKLMSDGKFGCVVNRNNVEAKKTN